MSRIETPMQGYAQNSRATNNGNRMNNRGGGQQGDRSYQQNQRSYNQGQNNRGDQGYQGQGNQGYQQNQRSYKPGNDMYDQSNKGYPGNGMYDQSNKGYPGNGRYDQSNKGYPQNRKDQGEEILPQKEEHSQTPVKQEQGQEQVPWYKQSQTRMRPEQRKDVGESLENVQEVEDQGKNVPNLGNQGNQGYQGYQSKDKDNNHKLADFWNQRVLDYLVEQLDQKVQKQFKPFNQNAEQIVVDSMGQTIQTRKLLPEHLLNLGVTKEFIDKSSIYQVDTIYSLWHSILALIYPEYVLLDYERKRMSVLRFRDTINSEFINNQKLKNEIIGRKIRLVHVENAINQDKIQDEILLRFFAIFFDLNIYLVTEDSCFVYHNCLDFTGKPLLSVSPAQNKSSMVIEPYNPYKSSIILYRFPYGNIGAVFQEGRQSQILSASTDPGFVLPISERFLGVNPEGPPLAVHQVDLPEVMEEVKTIEKAEAVPEVTKRLKPILKPIQKNDMNEDAKEKFLATMLKLKWEDIAVLAEKETVNPLQPTTKGFDSWKRKTKAQLAEEIWVATTK